MAKREQADARRLERDAELTKQFILDAAEIEFARHGLKGARIDAIAKAAGASPRMIYYYFESKEGLYKAVMERPAAEIHQTFEQLNLEQLPPTEALTAIIRAAITYEMNHHHRGMLLFQEASQNQGKYFKGTHWQLGFDLVTHLLKRGIEVGVFRNLDPEMTNLVILSACAFYSNAHENLKHLMPEHDLSNADSIERYIQATTQVLLQGLLKQSSPERQSPQDNQHDC